MRPPPTCRTGSCGPSTNWRFMRGGVSSASHWIVTCFATSPSVEICERTTQNRIDRSFGVSVVPLHQSGFVSMLLAKGKKDFFVPCCPVLQCKRPKKGLACCVIDRVARCRRCNKLCDFRADRKSV